MVFNGELILPKKIQKVQKMSFEFCLNFSSLTITELVTEIQEGAFYKCEGLKGNLSIPNHVKIISNYSFAFCINLNGISSLPSHLECIDEFAFYKCNNITGSY